MNEDRKQLLIKNDSTATLYLLFGTGTASASNYSVDLAAGAYYELPGPDFYIGELRGVLTAANGNARVTEITYMPLYPPPVATTPDADALTKGKVQLAGDLAGSASAPTVPSLATKAPLASPSLTGTPTAPTAAPGTNSTQLATTAFTAAALAALVVLDTLNELAAALGNDPNFATTIATSLGQKLVKTANLSDVASAATARANLGLALGSDVQSYDSDLAAIAALTPTTDNIGSPRRAPGPAARRHNSRLTWCS